MEMVELPALIVFVLGLILGIISGICASIGSLLILFGQNNLMTLLGLVLLFTGPLLIHIGWKTIGR